MNKSQLKHIIQTEVKKLTERTGDLTLGCLMLKLPIKNWDTLRSAINQDHIYINENGYGFESDPHVTILYGFHTDVTPSQIKDAVYNWVKKPLLFKLTKVGQFNNALFDVLKFDVEGPDLVKLNELFRQYPHTSMYPKYEPHATICYLKKGMAEKYIRELKAPIEISSNEYVFTTSNGKRYQWHNDKRLTNDAERFGKVGPVSL